MPRPRVLHEHPPEFQGVFRKAILDGAVSVPFTTYRKAWNFRARLYRYRTDVRNALNETPQATSASHFLGLTCDALSSLRLRIEHADDGGAVLHIRDISHDDETTMQLRGIIDA